MDLTSLFSEMKFLSRLNALMFTFLHEMFILFQNRKSFLFWQEHAHRKLLHLYYVHFSTSGILRQKSICIWHLSNHFVFIVYNLSMLIAHMTAVFNRKRHTNTIMHKKRFSRKYQKRALNYHESIHRVFFASGVVI